jgi:hypothetical protein
MPDYTPSDLPRLMVGRVKRIRVPNPFRHNILHTWYCPWGSYSARLPMDKKICPSLRTLTVEILAQ